MISIEKTLKFRLFKDNNLKNEQNSVAYSKNFDKIMFELNSNVFNILLSADFVELNKEDDSSIFYLSTKDNVITSYVLLKDLNARFDIDVEFYSIDYKDNKYILEYKLYTDDEKTRIEIEF